MYNATLTRQGDGGRCATSSSRSTVTPSSTPSSSRRFGPCSTRRPRGSIFHVLEPTDSGRLRYSEYPARYGILDSDTLLAMIRAFHWTKNDSIEPTLDFVEAARAESTLTDLAVTVPELAAGSRAKVATRYVDGERLDVLKRTRRGDRGGMFSGSSPRQRDALEIISGGADARSTGTGP